MASFEKAYASTPSGQMHFASSGTGDPLLLLGETPRSLHFFDRLIPLLAPHARVIAVDLPGLGNSHPLPDPMSVPAMARCLVDLLDALDIERADIFGMHTSEKIAAALAAGWPRRVDRLVLAGQTHSLFPEADKRNEALAPSFSRYHGARRESDDEGARVLRDWLAAKLTLDETWWPEPLVNGTSPTSEVVAGAEAKCLDYLHGWRSAVPIYRAVFDYDVAEAVARIEAETLVLEFTTPEEEHYGAQGERLAALMPRAISQSVAVTYLAALEEQPAEVAKAVLSFLGAEA